jgi:beta-ureidopropionase / N-carbamoyl-L-amino-acid hydrolase
VIDAERFRRLFAAVAAIGRTAGGWTRAPWSDEVREAERVVTAEAARSGLAAAHDPAGNLWLTAAGAPQRGLVASGSHLDTVPDGGAFDGALGVVCAVCAIGALRDAGVDGAERLAVISFADEEGWRFGTPIYGSRVLCGGYGPEILDRRDAEGARLGDLAPAGPFAARGLERRLAAFVEVHVEQGRALAPAGAALGVATALAARSRFAFACDGEANHAGTTPMAGRRDALVAAAGLVLAADRAARAEPGAVATVGSLRVEPGGSNVVPGRAEGTLDVRAPSAATRDRVLATIHDAVPEAALAELARDDGVAFAAPVREALQAGAAAAGATAADLASYAGHDAGVLQAAGVPAGMLFVRSPDGVSHSPREHADEADCLAACETLAHGLRALLAIPPTEG